MNPSIKIPSILIIGSTNTDMVVKTQTLPGPGQTVLGGHFYMNPGGKGANQAVAAARLNGNVTFLSKLGADIFGTQALEQFTKENIDTRYILTDPISPSGIALITVDQNGENCIVVAPGANATLTPQEIKSTAILNADIILTQLEIPLETVTAVVNLAATHDKPLILNPAPACPLPDDLLKKITILTPNEIEAELLTGIPVTNAETASAAAIALQRRGVETVIITLGKNGALISQKETIEIIPAPTVTPLDTTAAGDVFNGALAVALAEGRPIKEAIIFANHAAALSVTALGAQSSAPTRKKAEDFLKSPAR